MSKTKAALVAVQLLHAVSVQQGGKEKLLEAGGSVTLPEDTAAELVAAGAARYAPTPTALPAPAPKFDEAGGDLLQQGTGGTET
jgi:hypothetical protein